MGRPGAGIYGDADVGSAIEDIESIISQIKTNIYDKEDIIKLYNANVELLKAIIENENKD